jgi:hypothetical protein
MISSLEHCWRKDKGSSFINSQYLEPLSFTTKLISLIERNLLFPPFLDPFYVVLSRDGVSLFSGSFLGQLLSVPMVVLSCQRIRILILLHAHLVVLWVCVAPRRRNGARSDKRCNEEADRAGRGSCVRL